MAVAAWDLAKRWQDWDAAAAAADCPFDGSELAGFSANQQVELLATLLAGDPVAGAKLDRMEALYKFGECPNVEIKFRWLRLGIRARWERAVGPALELATSQGRMKFVRPLFRDLYAWEEVRQRAVDAYLENRDRMMHVCAEMVGKDLHVAK